jgi:hypothetical protein
MLINLVLEQIYPQVEAKLRFGQSANSYMKR